MNEKILNSKKTISNFNLVIHCHNMGLRSFHKHVVHKSQYLPTMVVSKRLSNQFDTSIFMTILTSFSVSDLEFFSWVILS